MDREMDQGHRCVISDLEALHPDLVRRAIWFRMRKLTPDRQAGMDDFFRKAILARDLRRTLKPSDRSWWYEVVPSDQEESAAAACLAERDGLFFLAALGASPAFRAKRLEKTLLMKLQSIAREEGGQAIYLYALSPDLFEDLGAVSP